MRLRRARLRVEELAETNKRWGEALAGQGPRKPGAETIVLASWEQLGQVFSPQRLEILSVVLKAKPRSISALARALKRDFKNVHSDVRLLAGLGLIDLKEEGKRKSLVPIAKFKELAMTFSG